MLITINETFKEIKIENVCRVIGININLYQPRGRNHNNYNYITHKTDIVKS